MKKYTTFYYLLFVLLVMGAFSSMAQNNYGNSILGGVAFAFMLAYALQLVTDQKKDRLNLGELAALTIISAILGFRVFYIHFKWIEGIYAIAAATLLGIRLIKLGADWKHYRALNSRIAFLLLTFHSSLALFIASIGIAPFAPQILQPLGVAAFTLMILFVIAAYISRNQIIEGEKISALKIVAGWDDHSIVMATLFFLFSLYAGLTLFRLTPPMYSDDLPQAYFEMIQGPAARQVDENKKADAFKKQFDEFVERHQVDKN